VDHGRTATLYPAEITGGQNFGEGQGSLATRKKISKSSDNPLGRINIPTLLAFASTPHRANRLLQEKLDFPIQGSALSRSELSQASLQIRWNTNQ
jgi:hypothetical protein